MSDLEKKVEDALINFNEQLRLDESAYCIEKDIFEWLKLVAIRIADEELAPLGAIIVLGDFERFDHCFYGMIQMKPKDSPIKSYISVGSDDGKQYMDKFSRPPYDGAVVVNKTGQIIGVGIYLVVDNPMLDIPDDCGARHKAAASFSLKSGVTSVLTISEETNTVRIWKDGQVQKSYRGKATSEIKNGEER